MPRAGSLLLIVGLVAGCTPSSQERVRDYNTDGVYLFQHGDFAHARDTFQVALALQPQDPTLLYNLGESYDRLGDSAKAETYYRECLARVPDHADARHALTMLQVRLGHRDQAEKEVRAWLAGSPKCAAAYAEDGWLYHQAGDLPSAQARLQQALSLDPHEPRALIELGRIYEVLQRPDRAIVLYERVLERNPRQVEVAQRVNLLKQRGAREPLPD